MAGEGGVGAGGVQPASQRHANATPAVRPGPGRAGEWKEGVRSPRATFMSFSGGRSRGLCAGGLLCSQQVSPAQWRPPHIGRAPTTPSRIAVGRLKRHCDGMGGTRHRPPDRPASAPEARGGPQHRSAARPPQDGYRRERVGRYRQMPAREGHAPPDAWAAKNCGAARRHAAARAHAEACRGCRRLRHLLPPATARGWER